ncbi:UNVERIFIED_CONTAM: hypothetical protein GTU68_024066 [Idotea baltica]|nr:hypothetical protein [Idotea baltica]
MALPSLSFHHRCPHCNHASKYKQNLLRHIKLKHTELKPFICKICANKFSLKQHLENHMRIHTGEKPYSCPRCFAKYRFASSLRFHMVNKSHCGESNLN